jgi:anti-anti-sigma factor
MLTRRPMLPEPPQELETSLAGRLTHDDAFELGERLTALAARRPRRLVLDLEEVTFLDAASIAILRRLERRVAASGGRVVVRAQGQVARTLRRVGAGELLEPLPGRAGREGGAVRSPAPGPAPART